MIPPLSLLLLATAAQPAAAPAAIWIGRSAELALACVHKEYPNKIAHVLNGDADVKAPRELTPAFYGCYDWHSSVHGHWLLARVARIHAAAPFADTARGALEKSITPANIAAEVRYLNGPGRVSFERPYGLAWLLQLDAELHEWATERPADADGWRWAQTLEPLTTAAIARIVDWLPNLTAPIRVGEHADGLRVRIDARLGAHEERACSSAESLPSQPISLAIGVRGPTHPAICRWRCMLCKF